MPNAVESMACNFCGDTFTRDSSTDGCCKICSIWNSKHQEKSAAKSAETNDKKEVFGADSGE